MDEGFQLAHAVRDIFRWRWNVRRVTGPAAADSVLAFSELPRLCLAAAALRQEHLVYFTDETKGERKAAPHALQSMIQGRYVV
jgi:hypothetical protein